MNGVRMVRRAVKFVLGAILFVALAIALLIGGSLEQRPWVALLGAAMLAIAILFAVLAVRVIRAARNGLSGETPPPAAGR